MPAWSLPEAIADILPAEARRIEALRRVDCSTASRATATSS